MYPVTPPGSAGFQVPLLTVRVPPDFRVPLIDGAVTRAGPAASATPAISDQAAHVATRKPPIAATPRPPKNLFVILVFIRPCPPAACALE